MSNNSSFYFGSSGKPKMSPGAIEKLAKQLKSEYLCIVLGLLSIVGGIIWLNTESKYSSMYEAGYWFIGGGFFVIIISILMVVYLNEQLFKELAKAGNEINDYISIHDNHVTGYGFVCRSGSAKTGSFSISVDDLCGATLSADGGVNIEVKDGNIFCKKLEDPQAAVFALSKLASSNK